ncbi:DUF3375 domain-containing protein (plasmid) [Mycolicibacterium fortuitum]|nr:DUF3375 domain-containing protein [Mycolicibacterium fortuitum]
MSGVAADLARAERAFDKPTLSLMSRKNAAVVIAVFTTIFGQEHRVVPADRFHTLVEALLGELRAAGADTIDEPARGLCRRWVGEQWLVLARATKAEKNIR